MPANDLPEHLKTPESMMRLFVLIGYSQKEILAAMQDQFGLSESDAADLYAKVSETHLSADQQAASH